MISRILAWLRARRDPYSLKELERIQNEVAFAEADQIAVDADEVVCPNCFETFDASRPACPRCGRLT